MVRQNNMFSTESEQTSEHPCLFPHPTASREGQTNAIFPAHSQTKCRAGKQLHIKDGGKVQNPRNDLICVFLCALTAVSFCYNGIFIVMICVSARLCCSTSKLVSLQLCWTYFWHLIVFSVTTSEIRHLVMNTL